LEDLDKWPEVVKDAQRWWIGKSEGHRLKFQIEGSTEKVEVFTSRLETLFGVTYVAISHQNFQIINKLKTLSPELDAKLAEYLAL
jgi:leucyl-tRNA synthetase